MAQSMASWRPEENKTLSAFSTLVITNWKWKWKREKKMRLGFIFRLNLVGGRVNTHETLRWRRRRRRQWRSTPPFFMDSLSPFVQQLGIITNALFESDSNISSSSSSRAAKGREYALLYSTRERGLHVCVSLHNNIARARVFDGMRSNSLRWRPPFKKWKNNNNNKLKWKFVVCISFQTSGIKNCKLKL